MPDTIKILGQGIIPYPGPGTIYTVPEKPNKVFGEVPFQAIVKSIQLCNRETSGLIVSSLNVVKSGESVADKNRIFWWKTVPAVGSDNTVIVPCGFTLQSGDYVSASLLTSSTKVSISIFGIEIT